MSTLRNKDFETECDRMIKGIRKRRIFIPCISHTDGRDIINFKTLRNPEKSSIIIGMMLRLSIKESRFFEPIRSLIGNMYFFLYPCKRCLLNPMCSMLCKEQETFHIKFEAKAVKVTTAIQLILIISMVVGWLVVWKLGGGIK
ncbi:MAG: hypothetical protein ACTSW1_07800 [Candidatus Hodarchaeales archaeon]